MNPNKLYLDIIQQPLDKQPKVGLRIAAYLANGDLDIMKVDALGYAQTGPQRRELVAVAKVCPGQPSVVLHPTGEVELNPLRPILGRREDLLDDVYFTSTQLLRHTSIDDAVNDVFGNRRRAHWIPVNERPLKYLTPTQMRMIDRKARPLYS